MVQIAGNVARERLLALTVGVALTFGLAEVGLRLLGPMFAVQRTEGEAKYTLLCEGDSFTYGIGGNAYPDQLQQLMNERHGEGTVKAVNTGIPGLNSALLADDLEAHLIEHKPDAVLVIVGENNSWNSIRLDDSGGAPSAWMRVDAMLLSSRVYKLVRVAASGWYYGTFHEARGVDHGFEGDDLELQRAANHLTDTREVIGYPEKEQAPRLPLAAYAGRYEDAVYGPAEVKLVGDQLQVELLPSRRRLHGAWLACDLYLPTDELSPADVLERVVKFLSNAAD